MFSGRTAAPKARIGPSQGLASWAPASRPESQPQEARLVSYGVTKSTLLILPPSPLHMLGHAHEEGRRIRGGGG